MDAKEALANVANAPWPMNYDWLADRIVELRSALEAEVAAHEATRKGVRDVVEEKARGGWCEECKQAVDEDFGPPEAHMRWCFVGRLLASAEGDK